MRPIPKNVRVMLGVSALSWLALSTCFDLYRRHLDGYSGNRLQETAQDLGGLALRLVSLYMGIPALLTSVREISQCEALKLQGLVNEAQRRGGEGKEVRARVLLPMVKDLRFSLKAGSTVALAMLWMAIRKFDRPALALAEVGAETALSVVLFWSLKSWSVFSINRQLERAGVPSPARNTGGITHSDGERSDLQHLTRKMTSPK